MGLGFGIFICGHQALQLHVLKKASFLRGIAFAPLSKRHLMYLCGQSLDFCLAFLFLFRNSSVRQNANGCTHLKSWRLWITGVLCSKCLDSKLPTNDKASGVWSMASKLKDSKKQRWFGEGAASISNLIRFYKSGCQEDRSLPKKGEKCERTPTFPSLKHRAVLKALKGWSPWYDHMCVRQSHSSQQ